MGVAAYPLHYFLLMQSFWTKTSFTRCGYTRHSFIYTFIKPMSWSQLPPPKYIQKKQFTGPNLCGTTSRLMPWSIFLTMSVLPLPHFILSTTLPVLSYSLKYSLIACHTGSSGDTHCNLHWLRLPTIWKAHLVKCRTVIQNGKPQTRVAFLHNCQMQRACATETQEETQVSIRK